MKVQDMKSLKISAAVLSMATLLFACPLSVSCPADHVDMHKVGDDYSGLVHFVIYGIRPRPDRPTVPFGDWRA
jgi:hypothetical protein